MNLGSNVTWVQKDGLKYIEFNNIRNYSDIVVHGFTTRLGGISSGECSSLNLGFNRKDARENVEENYRRIAEALSIQCENMVLSRQVHDNKVREVSVADKGKGIYKENDLEGYDGLMTNIPGIALVTFYADCVPVFFLDPVKRAIAVSHSGWRGTVKEIAVETLERMKNRYGCHPEDMEIAIGPSIGSCCFEVGEEVVQAFMQTLPWSERYCRKAGVDKWHIHLQGIIRQSLLNAGAREERINVSEICTKCNNEIFYSHRGDHGKTGSLAAIMQLV